MKLTLPPPLLFLLSGAFMYFLPPICPLVVPFYLILSVIALAFIIGAMSLMSFYQAKTTITPINPNKTSALVTDGIYRFTRNPMYLSLALLLCAWAMYLSHLLAWVGLPLFVCIINYLQIIPEEKVLEEKFGQNYLQYKKQVRRWI